MSDTAQEKTFILEDPVGSAAALRAWGGPEASLVVRTRDGKEVRLLSARGPHEARSVAGVDLVIKHGPRGHRIHIADKTNDTVQVRAKPGRLFLGDTPIGLWRADAPTTPCGAAVVRGPLPACLPQELQSLAILGDDGLDDLSPLREARDLSILKVIGPNTFSDLSPLSDLVRLTSLALADCKGLSDLRPLSTLTALTSVKLRTCKQLSDLSPLSTLRALTSLDVSGSERVSDISPLVELRALTSLNLSRCPHVSDLSPLSELIDLSVLNLASCRGVSDLSPLSGLANLTSLNLSFCSSASDLAPLSGLLRLTKLNLWSWSQISDIAALSGLRGLTNLNLIGCSRLSDLIPLSQMTGLTSLNLSLCSRVSDLAPLSELSALTSLSLRHCNGISDLSPLSALRALTSLDLSTCRHVTDLSPLSGLTSLTWLSLSSVDRVSDFSPLAGLHALTSLNLSRCELISDLSPVAGLRELASIDLSGCRKVSALDVLRGRTRLAEIKLTGCQELTLIAPILGCEALATLDLKDAGNIRDLDALSELTSLRELTWTETAAPMAVLAATAVRRGDVDAVEASAAEWLRAVRLSKIPDTFGFRLVLAFGLGQGAPWAAEALAGLARALRERARGDENPALVSAHTWEAWAKEALKLGPEDRRTALEAALSGLLAPREVAPVLTPVLTALSTLGPAQGPSGAQSAAPDLTGLSDLLAWVRTEVLAPLTAVPEHARLAAPAAAVLFAGFGLDAEVRAWLDRGTVPEAPHWRDRVLSALVARASRVADVHDARRWMAQIQSPESLDQCRAALAQALSARLPAEAAAELDAIGDDALRTRVALTLRAEPALLGTPAGLYALVLALQDEADALGEVLSTLVSAHPDSPLVAALVADLSPPAAPAPASAADLVAVTSHDAWLDEVPRRKWDTFVGQLPPARRLLAEAVTARATDAGLLDPDAAPPLLSRIAP
jgi:hypothetical protein